MGTSPAFCSGLSLTNSRAASAVSAVQVSQRGIASTRWTKAQRHQSSKLACEGGGRTRTRPHASALGGDSWPTEADVEAYVGERMSGADADAQRAASLVELRGAREALLLLSARMGDEETVRRLIALDGPPVDLNVADREGSTPVMRAASRGHAAVVAALLDTGRVDLARKNAWGYDAVIYAGSVRSSLPQAYDQLLRLFEHYGADPERAKLRWTQDPVYNPTALKNDGTEN